MLYFNYINIPTFSNPFGFNNGNNNVISADISDIYCLSLFSCMKLFLTFIL